MSRSTYDLYELMQLDRSQSSQEIATYLRSWLASLDPSDTDQWDQVSLAVQIFSNDELRAGYDRMLGDETFGDFDFNQIRALAATGKLGQRPKLPTPLIGTALCFLVDLIVSIVVLILATKSWAIASALVNFFLYSVSDSEKDITVAHWVHPGLIGAVIATVFFLRFVVLFSSLCGFTFSKFVYVREFFTILWVAFIIFTVISLFFLHDVQYALHIKDPSSTVLKQLAELAKFNSAWWGAISLIGPIAVLIGLYFPGTWEFNKNRGKVRYSFLGKEF
ncbi:MAG: hypothetical protein Q3962_03180 [Corynebacterium sp.]|nr:hypothetical protein [Corynebacterium sp.]